MLDIDFADREYELGGRIDVSITLRPHRDIRIRHARVDVVCNQTYTHHSAWEGGTVPRVGYSGRGVVAGGMDVDQRTESYVHSTVRALRDTSFTAGIAKTHRVGLGIDPMPPKRWNQAVEANRNAAAAWSFAWTLSVSLDVARGRDRKVEHEVRIKLPPLPAGTTSAKPSMSRPKRPTGQRD